MSLCDCIHVAKSFCEQMVLEEFYFFSPRRGVFREATSQTLVERGSIGGGECGTILYLIMVIPISRLKKKKRQVNCGEKHKTELLL